MNELISVIVPVYNVAEYLPRCLDSIINQTYHPLEIIAINDGSMDQSLNILNDYATKYDNIKIINQENSGVSLARTNGILASNGNWIGFVDSDDYIEPEMYEILYKNAKEYDADISHCGYQLCFPDRRVHYFYDTKKSLELNTDEGLAELLTGSSFEPGLWNKLYKRDLFNKMFSDSLLDHSIKINEDLLMNYYLFKEAKRSIFFDVCLYHYMARNLSATRQKINKNKLCDPIRVKKLIYDDASSQNKNVALIAYLNTCIDACNSIFLSKSKEFDNELQHIICILKKHRNALHIISKKRRLLIYFLLSFPQGYGFLYSLYVKYNQNNKYE